MISNQQFNSYEDLIHMALPLIKRESDKIWYKVNDVTVFEQRCFKHIDSAHNKLGNNIKIPKSLLTRIIKRASAHCINEVVSKDVISLELLADSESEDSKKRTFEPVDIFANIESEVIAREKVANLAGSDLRKKVVLNAWKDGCTNETEIANLLADKLGGSFEGHRSFVKRFREKCKSALAGVA